jgi:vesicle transport through interaction with t-SNAREs protein 1
MEIEVQGMPQSIKPQYQTRIRSAKTELTRYKKLSKDLHAQLSRSDLLGGVGGRPIGPSSADDPYGTGDRTRLLAGTSLLEDGTRRLQESQRIALETEEQGADILSNLRRQREQIENSRDTVRPLPPSLFYVWHTDTALRSCILRMRQSTELQERSRR